MGKKVWTISNVLSISRILLALPICLLILGGLQGNKHLAIILIMIAALTDLFDGMLARKFGQVTDLGKILDPVADKIAVVAVIIVLTVEGMIPVWLMTLIVLRDILIFAGGVYIRRKSEITLQSNWIGKWTVTLITLLILLIILDIPGFNGITQTVEIISVFMIIISFVSYLRRFFQVLHKNNIS